MARTEKSSIVVEELVFFPFEEFGSYLAIENGILFSMPMNIDGTPDKDGLGEITAPEEQSFLDIVNAFFNTEFRLEDFAGR